MSRYTGVLAATEYWNDWVRLFEGIRSLEQNRKYT